MSAKLPNLAENVFADSPLRSTEPKRVALVTPPAKAAYAPTEAMNPPDPAAGEGTAAPRRAPAMPPKKPRTTAATEPLPEGQEAQIKMTVYLSKSQVDRLEEEVFHRRRAGDRIGNTDLMRELVDYWLARAK